jgi:hypothetical protein
MMKKKWGLLVALIALAQPVYAFQGEMGYFGGTSTGYALPTTTALMQDKVKTLSTYTLPYKEVVYLSGEPVEVEGTIRITPGKMDKTKGNGTFTESYRITAESADGQTRVTRNISFDTQFVYDAVTRQTRRTSKLKNWTENVTINGYTYRLINNRSSFSKSIIEDDTPGVSYYRGDVNYEAVYEDISGGNGEFLTVAVNGPIYGYEQAFAKTETQKRSITITGPQGQYYIEEMPTYTVFKDIQYGANDPFAISFEGNYREVIRSEGSVNYNMLVASPYLYRDEKVGATAVTTQPVLEQLSIPNLPQIKGHPAESDIKKMYSMGIFTENFTTFSPSKVITRGEYIKMLVKAFQMPLPETKKSSFSRQTEVVVSVFNDVGETNALYPYLMAAYNAGLISGGTISPNTTLTREEMYALNVSAMGLGRLGIVTLNQYTPFIDDAQIADRYKSLVYAASQIGIADSANGYLLPKRTVTYAEGAAFLNKMIEYLRYDLQKDYAQKMLY